MKKILFLIHDLGRGGAEKVLVNLVNNMDPEQFDITVVSLFGGGVNERNLNERIKYRCVFPRMIPGNSHFMKLFSPGALHRFCVRERYDIEVAYLEGPSARVVSGCTDAGIKRVCWIHSILNSPKKLASSFRSEKEALDCYRSFDRIACVSETVKDAFQQRLTLNKPAEVLYNTVESDRVLRLSAEETEAELFRAEEKNLIAVGTLKPVKAFDRLIRITGELRREGIPAHLYLLGDGPEKARLEQLARDSRLEDAVSFLGYRTNPYAYLRRGDLFVCSSLSEGFSTAATEALIVGTPVCTTEVSGMREMLGDSEFGLITGNDEQALYEGLKRLLTDRELLSHYKKQAEIRGKTFSTEQTVHAVEEMLNTL